MRLEKNFPNHHCPLFDSFIIHNIDNVKSYQVSCSSSASQPWQRFCSIYVYTVWFVFSSCSYLAPCSWSLNHRYLLKCLQTKPSAGSLVAHVQHKPHGPASRILEVPQQNDGVGPDRSPKIPWQIIKLVLKVCILQGLAAYQNFEVLTPGFPWFYGIWNVEVLGF